MMLFWLELEYGLAMLAWLSVLFAGLYVLLKLRRRLKRQTAGAEMKMLKAGLSLWCLLALLTGLELGFALFADHTDAFCRTNISRRWFRRYLDAQRNAEGFRDRREFLKTIPEGKQRVLFFGDSFTIGHGVRRCEDRFSDRVEVLLNEREPGRWEVANLGEAGYEVSLIEGLIRASLDNGWQAHQVVYVCMLNDIEGYDPRTEATIKEIQKVDPQFFLWSKTYFFNWLFFRWQQMRMGFGVDYFPHLADSYRSPAWQGMRASILKMQQSCRDHGVEFRMVLFPFLHNLGPDYPFAKAHEQLRELGRIEGIPVLDLEPVLRGHSAQELTVNRFDNHPNEFCHSLAAQAIFDWLKSPAEAAPHTGSRK